MDTIEYYNKYASRIFEDTVDRDMEPQREEFLEELREIDATPSWILDAAPAATAWLFTSRALM